MDSETYPDSRYGPSPLVDLRTRSARERLSRSALKALFNILGRWKVQEEVARDLLGGISHGTFYAIKRNPAKVLSPDELLRVSYLVGIFKALNILYSEKLADAWIQLPNSNRIFAGATPLAYIRKGGLPALETVRRLLDARRGGQ